MLVSGPCWVLQRGFCPVWVLLQRVHGLLHLLRSLLLLLRGRRLLPPLELLLGALHALLRLLHGLLRLLLLALVEVAALRSFGHLLGGLLDLLAQLLLALLGRLELLPVAVGGFIQRGAQRVASGFERAPRLG